MRLGRAIRGGQWLVSGLHEVGGRGGRRSLSRASRRLVRRSAMRRCGARRRLFLRLGELVAATAAAFSIFIFRSRKLLRVSLMSLDRIIACGRDAMEIHTTLCRKPFMVFICPMERVAPQPAACFSATEGLPCCASCLLLVSITEVRSRSPPKRSRAGTWCGKERLGLGRRSLNRHVGVVGCRSAGVGVCGYESSRLGQSECFPARCEGESRSSRPCRVYKK